MRQLLLFKLGVVMASHSRPNGHFTMVQVRRFQGPFHYVRRETLTQKAFNDDSENDAGNLIGMKGNKQLQKSRLKNEPSQSNTRHCRACQLQTEFAQWCSLVVTGANRNMQQAASHNSCLSSERADWRETGV